jgi:hypothetical protein
MYRFYRQHIDKCFPRHYMRVPPRGSVRNHPRPRRKKGVLLGTLLQGTGRGSTLLCFSCSNDNLVISEVNSIQEECAVRPLGCASWRPARIAGRPGSKPPGTASAVAAREAEAARTAEEPAPGEGGEKDLRIAARRREEDSFCIKSPPSVTSGLPPSLRAWNLFPCFLHYKPGTYSPAVPIL